MKHHRPTTRAEGDDALPVIALVGRPNVGKSTFLATASGRYVESVNAPGTTVAAEHRVVHVPGRSGTLAARVVDLPGASSMADESSGIAPFWRLLLDEGPDAILFIGDAGDIARHLPLALACRDLGLPLVVAANLADDAEARGVRLDAGRLSQLLAAPVHVTVGRDGRGVIEALRAAVDLALRRRAVRDGASSPSAVRPASPYPPLLESRLAAEAATIGGPLAGRSLGAAVLDPDGLSALVAGWAVSPRGAASIRLADQLEPVRWEVAQRWARQVERRDGGEGELWRDRLARLVTAPLPGLPLFVGVTIASFLAMVAVGGWLSEVLNTAWAATFSPWLASATAVLPGPLGAVLLWGLDSGLIGLISVGIPYVLTFYLLLAALEDSGYLTSAAVLGDRLFNLLGLPGRAAIPLLAAAGCNVPAIYGTRVLATRRERLIGSFLVTMTPCSARSAVVIAAITPFVGLAAAVAAFGIVAGLAIASGILANRLIPGTQPPLVLELAPLRRPLLRQVAGKAWLRFGAFVRQAAPVMLAGSLVLGALYETGLVWPLGGAIAPVVEGWLGLPPVAGLALIFAFLRKELALQLLIALAVIQFGAGAESLASFMSSGQLFVYAIVTAVSIPCIATLAALAGEFGWRIALGMSAATLGIALAAGGVLARLLGIA